MKHDAPIGRVSTLLLASLLTLAAATQAGAQTLPVPTVCFGCAPGGPEVFVTSGVANVVTSGNHMEVVQQTPRAVLNWQSFNIGADSSVRFDQPSSDAVALNRIYQLDPSLIQGSLTANGQVYLINQNGIIFGQGAYVDVHSLTASTLNISDEVFNNIGLTGAINQGLPAFDGGIASSVIRIESGATLRSGEGGRILIVAPQIDNHGSIETPAGQAILTASQDRVYLASSDDDSLRGLLVEVGTGGTVNNLGSVIAERGNVTLMGLAVNQNGIARATTSVNLNGSVHLLARDRAVAQPAGNGTQRGVASRTGDLVLGATSRTEVLPDDLTESATDSQVQPDSVVQLMGGSITLRSGAQIVAPAGDVRITATRNPAAPGISPENAPNDSQVNVEAGSRIDVAGLRSAVLSMDANELSVELRGSQLQDSPLQRDGVLRNQTIVVDARKGTPLANISGELAARQHTLEERLVIGGNISIESEGDIGVHSGSVLDVSGGQIRYESGVVNTTKLLADRQLIDIGDASPDIVYQGLFGPYERRSTRWGITESFGSLVEDAVEAGYVDGFDAGALTLSARELQLGGELRGTAVAGLHQREAAAAPQGGQLILGNAGSTDASRDFGLGDFTLRSLTDLGAVGISRLGVYSNGRITLPEAVTLALPDGGSLALAAGELELRGRIVGAGATVSVEARSTVDTPVGESSLLLGNTGVIDVGGGWINDSLALTPGTPDSPLFIDGGSVTLRAAGDLLLDRGSRIDVSGGGQLQRDNEIRAGAGGNITLSARLDQPDPVYLLLDGELSGFALERGGTLSLQAAGFHIGAGSDVEAAGKLVLAPEFLASGGFANYRLDSTHTGISVGGNTTVVLQSRNLIADESIYSVASVSDLEAFTTIGLLPDYERNPVSLTMNNRRAQGVTVDDAVIRIGRDAGILTDAGGSITLDSDSRVLVDGTLSAPGGAITLRLAALSGGSNDVFDASQAIWLQSGGRLLAPGAVELEPLSANEGRSAGRVFDAGNITIDAERGYFIAEPNSQIDVSGVAARLAVPTGTTLVDTQVYGAAGSIDIRVAEGAILAGDLSGRAPSVDGAAGALLKIAIDPADRGFAAFGQTPFPTGPRDIVLSNTPLIVAGGAGGAVPAAVNGLVWLNPSQVTSGSFDSLELRTAIIGADTASARIRFDGDVTLSLRDRLVLDAPILQSDGGSAQLSASYVSLGSTSRSINTPLSATEGSGVLTVEADHVDLVGTLALRGFGGTRASTIASRGDIRLSGGPSYIEKREDGVFSVGRLSSMADLTLRADQVYSTTVTDYTIAVGGIDGRITVEAGDAVGATPLSAGSRLQLSADHIDQRGVLRAPFGQIMLDAGKTLMLADGSVTSVSGDGLVVPFGYTQFGADLIYPLLLTAVYDAPPEKSITLRAPDLQLASGSTVDISGGGDLLAREFLPGPGGSSDVLAAAGSAGAFAIVPTQRNLFGVFDPLLASNSGVNAGDTITFGADGPVPPGEYAVLPAGYALLPGAYLVTPVNGTPTAGAVGSQLLANGSAVVSARRSSAGSGAIDSLWSSHLIENGEQVRARAEYTESFADEFLSARADDLGLTVGRLNLDAGRLVIEAGQTLSLQGQLDSATNGGRGAEVDIVASQLAVVADGGSAAPGQVALVASEINRLGAESVLIGGVRRTAAEGDESIAVAASDVRVSDGATLNGPELMLVANRSISIDRGASITNSGGERVAAPDAIALTGNGALVRVSSGDQVDVERTGSNGSVGVVTIAEGATLSAASSLTLDASRDTIIDGNLRTDGGSISLAAARIGLGDAPGGNGGLTLTAAEIAALNASDLRLRSAGNIDIYGSLSLSLSQLTLQGAGLFGHETDGGSVQVRADTVVLRNPAGRTLSGPATGMGELTIAARDIELGEGAFSIRGFADVNLRADQELAGSAAGGESALHVAGDLQLLAARISGASGTDLVIDTADASGVMVGALALARPAQPATLPPVTALGGRLQLAGTGITHDGNIELPSGIVEMTSTGSAGIAIGAGSGIDVSGRDLQFADVLVGSPGGTIRLRAMQGDLMVESQARLDVSASSSGGHAGLLELSAGAGRVNVAGDALLAGDAAAGESQGQFELLAATLTSDFAVLNRQLNAAAFTDSREFQIVNGDIAIDSGDVIRARRLVVSADGGSITVAGLINASGDSGGSVSLSARDNLTLLPTARILASASEAGERGGRAELATSTGQISLAAADVAGAAIIDVSGGDAGSAAGTGRVLLRAPRVGTTGVGVQSLAGRIAGAGSVDLEAFRVYSSGVVDVGLLNAVNADTATYMASAAAIENALGVAENPAFHLRPGVEIRSAGDLNVNSEVDLLNWRYGGEAGVLTLRAAGNLNVNSGIRDGVADVFSDLILATRETAQSGDSWSLRLAGGSDLNAADVMAVSAGIGDVVLAAGARVRTGTGDIAVAAGRDIRLTDASAAIYTVGVNRGTGALPTGGLTPEIVQELLYEADFLRDGGNIDLRAGRDIVGADGHQFYSEWLARVAGNVELPDGAISLPASWAVNSGLFNQNVGALGGGDVRIVAGRDLLNLSAVIPTTSQPVAGTGQALANAVAGGGDLDIVAGDDILGGMYLVSRGDGTIRAGGALSSMPGQIANAILGLGEGSYDVEARRTLAIESVLNPTVIPVSASQGYSDFLAPAPSFFFTYGTDSGVRLTALSGDVRLQNRASVLTGISSDVAFPLTDQVGLTIYPSTVSARSLQGSIINGGSFVLMPAPSGNLQMLAQQDIGIASGADVNIYLSDSDPLLLPDIDSPASGLQDVQRRLTIAALPEFHAAVPVHAGDATSVKIVAQEGNIGSADANSTFAINSAKQTTLVAGTDIRNLRLQIQHANATDVSVIQAGDDIVFPSLRTPSGTVVANTNMYEVAGAGQLYVLAGDDVDLGSARGIRSLGNLANPALLANGADINVVAGLRETPDYAAFVELYLGQSPVYSQALTEFLSARGISGAGIDEFRALPLSVQRELVLTVFFEELRRSGVDATAGSNDYTRGFNAIATLFPGQAWDGDIKSFLSQIATLDGGDIRLLAPGGLINAGVAAASGITKSPSELGITAQRDGNIEGFALGSFLVNQSRVFALDGGDITIWSSTGDIDAGRGAKTALSIPPPTVTFDASGNAVVEFPPAVTGSGIRGAVSTLGRRPGDVYLFAPAGVVDAGDAGIVSAGNITIGATAVLGADNIDVGGIAVGVPVDTGGLGASLAGVSATASSASNAATTANTAEARQRQDEVPLAQAALSWLEVFVLGLGEENCRPDDIECLKRQGEN